MKNTILKSTFAIAIILLANSLTALESKAQAIHMRSSSANFGLGGQKCGYRGGWHHRVGHGRRLNYINPFGYGGFGYGGYGYGYSGWGYDYPEQAVTSIQKKPPLDRSFEKWQQKEDKRRMSLPRSAFVKEYH